MYKPASMLFLIVIVTLSNVYAQDVPALYLHVPRLDQPTVIDGDLTEWKDYAFTDGVWDIYRLRQADFYDDGRRNRLTDQGDQPEGHPEEDLQARYYIAWDAEYIYLGAEVKDNYNDTVDPNPADRRWMFKDSICWFIEAPGDNAPEWFGQGDNAFCFVIDASRPSYATWWRHGSAEATMLEDPIPPAAVEYGLKMNPWGTGEGDFILEAKVAMAPTFGQSDPRWQPPQVGDEYRLEIVHCDPDGGDYGGHFMIYGTGDDDTSWGHMILVGPQEPYKRLPK